MKEYITIKTIIFNKETKSVLNKKDIKIEYEWYNQSLNIKNKPNITIRQFIQIKILNDVITCINDNITNIVRF